MNLDTPPRSNTQLKPKKPKRWKRMPLRDANGNWATIIEFVPATNPLVHERFATLARTLYQKWVVESPPVKNKTVAPSEIMAQSSDSTQPSAADCPTHKLRLTTTDESGHVG